MIIWEHADQHDCQTESLEGQTIDDKHLCLLESGYKMLHTLGVHGIGQGVGERYSSLPDRLWMHCPPKPQYAFPIGKAAVSITTHRSLAHLNPIAWRL